MSRRQGVHTEFSIRDLNTLAPCSVRSSKTCKTASTDLSNSANLSKGKLNSSKSSMNRSCESFNSSFSDLAKERSGDFSFDSGAYTADFTASNSTLDWDDNEAFPKVKGSSTPSTSCSTTEVDMTEFVVLSAFQIDGSGPNQGEGEEEFDEEEEDDESEYSEVEDDSEEEDFPELEDEEVGEDGEEDEEEPYPSELDESQCVLAPSPRDSVRVTEKRRSALDEDLRMSRKEQENQAALCQFLARSGIERSPSIRRGRGRSFKQQAAPMIRTDSSRSSMAESEAAPARMRRHLSGSRPPPTRGRRVSVLDGSIRRDRSTSSIRSRSRSRSINRSSTHTAPNPSLDIVLDRPLLGKSRCDDSEVEEDLFAVPATLKVPVDRAPVDRMPSERRLSTGRGGRRVSSRLRDSDDCSRDSSSGKIKRSSVRRHRSSTTEAKAPPTRRSVRASKSGGAMPRPMNDMSLSSRSNPEHATISLEERLNNLALIDVSSQSNPETVFAVRGDAERKRLARRKSSRKVKSPPLSSVLG